MFLYHFHNKDVHYLTVCWMKAVAQVLADGLGRGITQLFHITRKILSSPVKSMRGAITASVLSNMGCGRP